MRRRAFLAGSAAALGAAACTRTMTRPAHPTPIPAPARAPVLFVSHGAPTLAVDAVRGAGLRQLGRALPRPHAILVVSAHWLDAPPTLGTSVPRPLLYDFHGFPDELYRLRYPAPGAPELAASLAQRLPGLQRDDERPWDHGVWVPLLHLFPDAAVPVLQLSLPWRRPPAEWLALGRALAPLRDEGVLLLASGGAVHNLGRLDWAAGSPPPAFAVEFEAWLRERLAQGDVDALAAFRDRAPALRLAHPTDEHLAPLLVALGAAAASGAVGEPSLPVTGFDYGSLSRLAVRWG